MPYPGVRKRVRMVTRSLNEATDVYDLADPTSIALTIEAPDGTETAYAYPGTITRSSIGRFYVDHTTDGQDGVWKIRAVAAGALIAVGEATFTVLPTLLVP